VIFLAGLGRSGTTLLERAVGELPRVQPLGEVTHLWRRGIGDDELCGCGDRFSRCPFWQAVGQRAFGGWGNVDLGAIDTAKDNAERLRRIPELLLGRGRSSSRASARLIAESHRRIYDAVAALTGADVVVDSSKHPALAYCLCSHPGIDLRVVHVVRDSRGVAYSWTKSVQRPEAKRSSSSRRMTQYAPTRSALLWSAENAAVALLPSLGTRVLLVRYESFVEAPKTVIAEVARHAGLDIGEEDVDFVSDASIRLTPAHTSSGNPLRFTSGQLMLQRDDAWRTELPAVHRLVVGAITYPQLVRYRYTGRGNGRPA
jgi:hypothetical protein